MNMKKIATTFACGALAASLILGGCGKINGSAVVSTVNGKDISLGYANFVALLNQYNYDSYLGYYYGEGYWTSAEYVDDEGQTMEQMVKNDVIKAIQLNLLLEEHMDEYGVTITDEEKAAMTAAAEKFIADNDKKTLDELCATQEVLETYLYYTTVEEKMEAAIRAACDTEITDEEAAQTTFSYVKFDNATYSDEDGNKVEYTDEEKDEILRTANAFAEAAKIAGIDSAAESYDETVQTYSFGADEASEEDGGFCDAVIEAVSTMVDGGISNVIEGTDCYYVVCLVAAHDEEATEKKRESLQSSAESTFYTTTTSAYQDAAEITLDEKQWAKVKFDQNFYAVESEEDTDAAAETDSSATAETDSSAVEE